MPRSVAAAARRTMPRLALELLVVVLGITISFWFQDWRQQRDDRQQEARLLQGIVEELRADRTDLRRRLEMVDGSLAAVQRLQRDGETMSAEELDRAMDQTLSYIAFAPSRASYVELQQMAGSRLVRDKRLLHQVITLYERAYPMAVEWDGINRQFVLDRMFPYIDRHGPSFVSTSAAGYATGYHQAYRAIAGETEFRNLLRSALLFKEGQRATYAALLDAVGKVLTALGGTG
jgi:hypothetical protein